MWREVLAGDSLARSASVSSPRPDPWTCLLQRPRGTGADPRDRHGRACSGPRDSGGSPQLSGEGLRGMRAEVRPRKIPRGHPFVKRFVGAYLRLSAGRRLACLGALAARGEDRGGGALHGRTRGRPCPGGLGRPSAGSRRWQPWFGSCGGWGEGVSAPTGSVRATSTSPALRREPAQGQPGAARTDKPSEAGGLVPLWTSASARAPRHDPNTRNRDRESRGRLLGRLSNPMVGSTTGQACVGLSRFRPSSDRQSGVAQPGCRLPQPI